VLIYIRALFSNYENLLHCDRSHVWARLLLCCYLVFKDRLTPHLPPEVSRALCRGEAQILVNFKYYVNKYFDYVALYLLFVIYYLLLLHKTVAPILNHCYEKNKYVEAISYSSYLSPFVLQLDRSGSCF
jgi:hypothetical protein